MPAINPARLKIQVTHIVEKFGNPTEFRAELHDLLNFYADRTRKPGRGSPRLTQIRAYNVPRQVIRQIESLLAPKISSDPDAALILADALWQEPWLECRLLAVGVLSSVPSNPPERIIERITSWGEECGVDRQLDTALAVGFVKLRIDVPKRLFRLLESWTTSPNPAARRLGLRVVPHLVDDRSFENLPAIFGLISPLIENTDLITDVDLMEAISSLARRSPQETVYFLKQSLAKSDQSGMDVFIRRIMDAFPEENRQALRKFLRQRREELGDL
jgi:hypothetical protein